MPPDGVSGDIRYRVIGEGQGLAFGQRRIGELQDRTASSARQRKIPAPVVAITGSEPPVITALRRVMTRGLRSRCRAGLACRQTRSSCSHTDAYREQQRDLAEGIVQIVAMRASALRPACCQVAHLLGGFPIKPADWCWRGALLRRTVATAGEKMHVRGNSLFSGQGRKVGIRLSHFRRPFL